MMYLSNLSRCICPARHAEGPMRHIHDTCCPAYKPQQEHIDPPATPLSPGELLRLEQYNAERARGIMHRPDWIRYMDRLQKRYDHYAR